MYCSDLGSNYTDTISSKFMHNKTELDRRTFTTTNNFLKTFKPQHEEEEAGGRKQEDVRYRRSLIDAR